MSATSTKFRPTYLLGIGVTLLILVLAFFDFRFFQGLERDLLDLRFILRGEIEHEQNVTIVTVDDKSINKLGKWPWKRSVFADLVDILHDSGAKVIGMDIYFQKDSNRESQKEDLLLAESVERAGNVILPIYFNFNKQEQTFVTETHQGPKYTFTKSMHMEEVRDSGYSMITGYDLFSSYPELNQTAWGMGHINHLPDPDGIARREILAISYENNYYPCLGLRIVQKYLGADKMLLDGNDGIRVGDTHIPIAPYSLGRSMVWGMKIVNFRGGYKSFAYHSIIDVLEHRFPQNAFKDKIVLVGATSPGLYDVIATPYTNLFPGVERHANVIDNALMQGFITRPFLSDFVGFFLCILFGAALTFILPRLNLATEIIVIVLFTLAYLVVGQFLFSTYGLWINLTYPLLTIWFVSFAVILSLFLLTKKAHREAVDETYEATKMLGLAFQEKGMLEMAYEKFIKLPMSLETMDLLYNLGVELQKKRKETLATTIFKKLYQKDPYFEDVTERLETLGVVVVPPERREEERGTTFMDKTREEGTQELKPGQTLGRYEVVKKLGEGNMGAVYLGQDPTIDRQVALKTFHLAQFVQEEKLEELKRSFLREARLAGKLNHPNIVTIFDAGEDWDLSWIAMEVLEGEELKRFCRKEHLLTVPKVLKVIATLALALDYAHSNGVIHRDIKPANVMIPKSGPIKITDFGIALVRGEIGKIAGTPSYMAPEQIGGQSVDGRTDIYALGVVFFELLTGQKPFSDKNLQGLREKILHTPLPDIRDILPGAPDDLKRILDGFLAKDKEKRFASGREVVRALKEFSAKQSGQKDQNGPADQGRTPEE